MFCTNCDKEDTELVLQRPVCKVCGFDNSSVLRLLEKDDDEDEYDETEDEFRTSLECAHRCVILYGVISAGHDGNRSEIIKWLKSENLWDFVTEEEMVFLESKSPSKQAIVNITWRIEALHLLLWALNKLPSATDLTNLCNVEEIQTICDFYLKSTKQFIKSSVLRNEDEIFDVNEIIYDSHWKVRDAQINDGDIPDDLNSGLIKERHHAINWVMGYCGQEWDEITTDT